MGNIHKQVEMQLEYLKYWVEMERKNEEDCKRWGIPYTPSRRKWTNKDNYELYKEEVEKNGDKNLLLMVRLNGEDGIGMYGVYPFARRYKNEKCLIHRTEYGAEILLNEETAKIIVSA